eukprot:SAG22_NODE_1043_length_5882_cov_148.833132_2_plen_162_part_00
MLPFCCASTARVVLVSKAVPFLAVCLPVYLASGWPASSDRGLKPWVLSICIGALSVCAAAVAAAAAAVGQPARPYAGTAFLDTDSTPVSCLLTGVCPGLATDCPGEHTGFSTGVAGFLLATMVSFLSEWKWQSVFAHTDAAGGGGADASGLLAGYATLLGE